MSYRAPSYKPATDSAPAQVQAPSALRIMTALVIAFVLITLVIMLAGRVPLVPSPITQPGTTAAQYVEQATQLLNAAPGRNSDGTYHIPIEQAVKLIAERGLPVRDNPSQTPKP
jgi:hypothetical protein